MPSLSLWLMLSVLVVVALARPEYDDGKILWQESGCSCDEENEATRKAQEDADALRKAQTLCQATLNDVKNNCKTNNDVQDALNKAQADLKTAHSNADRLSTELSSVKSSLAQKDAQVIALSAKNQECQKQLDTYTTKTDDKPYTYVGCFIDSADRDLSDVLVNQNLASVEFCRDLCHGYAYFSMQAGAFCLCGHQYGRHGRVDDKECNMACTGNSKQFCGAGWRNSVYYNKGGATFLGCFIDSADRDLDGKIVSDGAMSVNLCRAICSGFKYFGLQAGGWCLCGNRVGKHGNAVATSQCNQRCTGDAKEFCGAGWRNSVYQY